MYVLCPAHCCRLCFSAAETNADQSRVVLLEVVKRLPNVEDRVDYLERGGYITEAAGVLQEHGTKLEKCDASCEKVTY